MAKKRQRPYALTFIKQWRKHRDLSLEKLSERMRELCDYRLTKVSLSRIERGLQPYSQDTLEALAECLETDPASLLMRDPTLPDAIWTIWDNIPQESRDQALRVMEQFVPEKKRKKAG